MSAFEAKQYGLVSEVYKEGCLDEVWTYLKKLSQLSSEVYFSIICFYIKYGWYKYFK